MKSNQYSVVKDEDGFKKTLSQILKSGKNEKPFLLGLCGGRSISPMIQLIDGLECPDVMSALTIDERAVPINDRDSNYLLLRHELDKTTQLKDKVDLAPFNVEKEENSVSIYSSVLEKHHGIFDLIFLGVGEDGHIASIFPNLRPSHSLKTDYIVFEGSPKPPSRRVTANHSVISKANNNILLLFGEGKRQAYENLLNPELTPMDCPAKYALESANTVIFTDLD